MKFDSHNNRLLNNGDKQDRIYKNQLIGILISGIIIRIIVFFFQCPFNNDDHFEVIQYIISNHRLPISEMFGQAYHPPLYYIMASLFSFTGNPKFAQLFSLFLSIGTLLIIFQLIKNIDYIKPYRVKKYCLLFVSLLPQLIMFGNYISNDVLSFFIGSLIFIQLFKYIQNPGFSNQNILALYLGLGLLTKFTILPFVLILTFAIPFINYKHKITLRKNCFYLITFILIFSTTGSYKFIENKINCNRFLISNLDFDPSWANKQRPTYTGLKSLYDINLFKLFKNPTLSKSTKHSYPLMLYGTFWYQYIPESNFQGNKTIAKYIGSFIYVLATVPTLIFFIGFVKITYNFKELFIHNSNSSNFKMMTFECVSLLILLLNLSLIFIAGVKYDIWSIFQSRLLFPSFFAIIVLLNSGLNYIQTQSKIVSETVYLSLEFLLSLFVLYFIIEIVLHIMVL